MNKKTRDFTKSEAVRWIYNNNPGKIYVHHYNRRNRPVLLISKIPLSELKFPDEWYYDEDEGLTCRNSSPMYCCCCDDTVKIVHKP